MHNTTALFRAINMLIIGMVVLCSSITLSHASEKGKQVELVATLANGSSYNIADQKGKLVLIAIWATWCPICLGELPALEKIYLKNKHSGLDIIALNVDKDEKKLHDYLAKNKLSFAVAHRFAKGHRDNLDAPPVAPVFYLIGQKGEVIWRKIGAVAHLFPQ